MIRFEKEDDFIEICGALSVDENLDHVWIVESSFEFKDLPASFSIQVAKDDVAGIKQLKENVSNWAVRNCYLEANCNQSETE